MPGRLSVRALMFSLSVVAMGYLVHGVIEDQADRLGLGALASGQAQAVEGVPASEPQPEALAFDPGSVSLPGSFQPHWQALKLDDGLVELQVLERKFGLAETTYGSGSEYFDYAAALFEQMADEIHEPDLTRRLHRLSKEAQGMGFRIREAAGLRYDGPANNDMAHLQVHAALRSYLEPIQSQALVKLDYNQHGQLVQRLEPVANAEGGDILRKFRQEVSAILNHPASARYPESMALLKQEAGLLDQLASHLSMRWESTLACSQTRDCSGRAMYIRLYARQTLPAEAVETSYRPGRD